MKKASQFLAIVLTGIIAAYLTWLSNTDYGRTLYKELCCPKLSSGINMLFQEPNKYRNKNIQQRHVSKINYFYLQKGKDGGFDAMEDFILSNHYTRDVGYKVRAIFEWQERQYGNDAKNTNLVFRPICFIRETDQNKNCDFEKDFVDMIKDAEIITTEAILTQNLDTYLSNGIRAIVLWIIIAGAMLNAFCLLCFKDNKTCQIGKENLQTETVDIRRETSSVMNLDLTSGGRMTNIEHVGKSLISIVTAIASFTVSGLSIYLGYKLFLNGATGSFTISSGLKGVGIYIASAGPGLGFAFFGMLIAYKALSKLIGK